MRPRISIWGSVRPSVGPSVRRSVGPSVRRSVGRSFFFFLLSSPTSSSFPLFLFSKWFYLSVRPSVHMSVSRSVHRCLGAPVGPSVGPSVRPSVSRFVRPLLNRWEERQRASVIDDIVGHKRPCCPCSSFFSVEMATLSPTPTKLKLRSNFLETKSVAQHRGTWLLHL